MIDKVLSGIGLGGEEIRTYTALLDFGPTTVGNLAKKTGKPRASLYGFLRRLQEKGVIVQSLKSNTKIFIAEPLTKIALLFRQKIEELENNEKLYNDFVSTVGDDQSSKILSPRFQMYDDKKSLQNIMKDILLYRDIECQTFWPIKAMVEILSPEFFHYFNKERIKRNIYTRSIWPVRQKVNIKDYPYFGVGKEFKKEIRIAPEEVNFSMGYLLYKNKALFLSSQKESIGFIIESKELVEMLLSQFEIIWKMSKPFMVKPKDTALFLKEINWES